MHYCIFTNQSLLSEGRKPRTREVDRASVCSNAGFRFTERGAFDMSGFPTVRKDAETEQNHRNKSSIRSASRESLLAGWAVVCVFVCLAVIDRGLDTLVWGLVVCTVAAGMAAWISRGPSQAALIISIVLGLLLTGQQLAYFVADVTDNDASVAAAIEDGIGLVGALLILVGAITMVIQRSNNLPNAT
jgi:hypothetical protein